MCSIVTQYTFQVPLGVYLKNENVLDEMVSIMEDLHAYVPTIHNRVDVRTPGQSEPDTIKSSSSIAFYSAVISLLLPGSEDVRELGRIQLSREENCKVWCLALKSGTQKCV